MSDKQIKNRQRITVKPKGCPNPLFEKWLLEWKDEAANRNSDLKYCFDKALQSLRKYPLKLKTGRECLILKNFGTHLCEKLDKKLAEHNKNAGSADSSNSADDQNLDQNVQQVQSKPKKAKRKKDQNPETKSDESAPTSPKKRKSYVPGYRSGPYAILITLYQEQLKPTYPGFLKKAELQEKAQNLCDCSFVKPDPGSHYTAWSSMSTLLKKGFVKKQGNPAKFSLLKEGEELAKKLYDESNSSSSLSATKPALDYLQNTIPTTQTYYGIDLSDDELDFPPLSPAPYVPSPIKQKSKPSPAKKTLSMAISDSDTESNLEPKVTKTKKKSPKKFKSPSKNVCPLTVSDSEDEMVNGNQKPSPSSPDIDCIDLTDDNIEDQFSWQNSKPSTSSTDWLNGFNAKKDEFSWSKTKPSTSSNECLNGLNSKKDEFSWSKTKPSTSSNECVNGSNSKKDEFCSNDWFNEFNTKKDSQNDFSKPSSSETNSYSSAAEVEQMIFMPGDFEIILLVDTAETTGKFRNALSDDPAKELTKLGTKFEIRHLKVGDFVWISRHKNGKELTLPYVVERKRMDDLGGSIKDGRFHEQKFRLRQCGLHNVIYLVEKYAHENRLGLPLNTLHQAAMNTQVIDNFHVKYTGSYNHSMMYLSMMTSLLSDMFKDKTLISCPKNNLPPFNIKDELVSLITFEEFTKISAKNKVLKVNEMFIKQLLQLKGLSVEKATAITEIYPTPRRLIAGFKECTKPDLLLASIQYGALKRNIGPAVSKAVYQLYSIKKFP
ncbi:crossover junction endonuclease MUS81 [Planococcus citri]|uniref:crossover junction endonuclease MUS81 n=1 Tax=Planococcus citri TaxID=170843 RepID=UPI0031F8D750